MSKSPTPQTNQEKKVIQDLENQDRDYEHRQFHVDDGQKRLRIDKFLMNRIESVSRNKIQKAIEAGTILVNGQTTKSNYKVKPGDEIAVVLPERKGNFELEPEPVPVNIVYEDDQLIIVNKDAGIVVHPGPGNYHGTLVQGLLYHFENLPSAEDSNIRPGLVHRLDKETSGAMIVAKTDFAMYRMGEQFKNREVHKKYVALVWGDTERDEGTIETKMARHPKHRKKMAVTDEPGKGKKAVTHYKVLERFGYVTYIECQPKTGRTHQIRVHMKHLGHPVFQDSKYGGDKMQYGNNQQQYQQFIQQCFKMMPRQALHAKTIGFKHPDTEQFVTHECRLPQDFKTLLQDWREYIEQYHS